MRTGLAFVSVLGNLVMLIAIFSIKMKRADDPRLVEADDRPVGRLTALDAPPPSSESVADGTGGGGAVLAGAGRGIVVNGVPLEVDEMLLPWELGEKLIGIRGSDLNGNAELSKRLAQVLSITDDERAEVTAITTRFVGEAKGIESAGVKLVQDDDGSNYYVIEPNVPARLGLLLRLRGELDTLLGVRRALPLFSTLANHDFFVVDHGTVELAVEEEDGEFEFVIERDDIAGARQRQRRFMDKFGVGSIERRWGHLFDTGPWQEFLDAQDTTAKEDPSLVPAPARLPVRLPGLGFEQELERKTGSLLLDGPSNDGRSFYD